MLNIGLGEAGLTALMGYFAVFIGILILILVIVLEGFIAKKIKAMIQARKKAVIVDIGDVSSLAGPDIAKMKAAIEAAMEG